MLSALGSLASYAVPKLLTFASKKFFNTNIGSTIHKNLRGKGLENLGRNIGRNYKKMMNNSYD